MITFKEYLTEVRMSAKAYAHSFKRNEDSAKIGFELEVFVPEGTFYHQEPDTQAPATRLVSDMTTYRDIESHFKISNAQEAVIDRDFGDWKAEKEDAWVDENWQSYEDEDDGKQAETKARSRALKRITNTFTWDMWVKSAYAGKMIDFIEKYELEPEYGWADDTSINTSDGLSAGYYNGYKKTAKGMAEHLQRQLGVPFRVDAQGYATWNLYHDTSIKDKDGKSDEEGQAGVGVELVSPPLPPSEAMKQLEAVLKVLDHYDIETNESTGIHVNISLENMEHFDPLKLVLFMGDQHVLKKFDRAANSFTNSQMRVVMDSISANGKLPRSASELIALGKEGLAETGKYYSVNLSHLPKYLEFRAAGGADYHKRVGDIREVTGRWLRAMEIACNPDMHKSEYLKKVMQLLNPSHEDAERTKAMSLEQLVFKADGMFAWQHLHDVIENQSEDKSKKTKAMMAMMLTIADTIDEFPPTFPQKKEMRQLMQKVGASGREVADKASEAQRAEVEKSLRAFSLL
jgi:hypothetical protein